MTHTSSNLYGLPTIGLRFFNVYGLWGRLDMAIRGVLLTTPEGYTLQLN